MIAAPNITRELCQICDGTVECAPTAILLISLVHALYGHIGPEPSYFSESRKVKHAEDNLTAVYYNKLQERVRSSKSDQDDDIDEEYDFVVVGGGTAGSVLASRLTENRKWKVLLLEAGPEEPKITLIPGLTSEFKGSTLDWQYSMRPKQGFCEGRGLAGCEVVAARVLGGGSALNDMAYTRGNPADYDGWERAGCEGWGYDRVLPLFKRSEGNRDRDVASAARYHSSRGPLDVARYPHADVNVRLLLAALRELGLNRSDVNGRDQVGFARLQATAFLGERVSAHAAFLQPVRTLRSNLQVRTAALVTRIILTDGHARGVEYLKEGVLRRARAGREVLLSAGALGSPALLMRSGVGPRDYLEYLGVRVHRELPVGANLHDHVAVCLPVARLTRTATTARFPDKLRDVLDYYARGTGPLSANYQVVAYLTTTATDRPDLPDVEVRFRGHDSNMYYDRMDVCAVLLTPRSRGQLLLNATDPMFGKPLIYPNFLKYQSDEVKLLEGIQQIVKIFDTDAFKAAGIEFDPMPILVDECNSEQKVTQKFWSCIIRYFSEPAHNYVGTCKMGASDDPESVVDNQLRVYGITGLRVVDASIIPKIPRASTTAPVIMIAEMASDLIKRSWY